MSVTFAELPLRKETIEALHQHGFTAPFAIQEMVLPIALADGDVIGQAKTGTGKTLAFGIPVIERVIAPKDPEWATLASAGQPQALIVVPTRELCVQVTKDIEELSHSRGIRTLAVYGGRAFEPQIEALESGVEIVVGTPGRLLDLYRQGALRFEQVVALGELQISWVGSDEGEILASSEFDIPVGEEFPESDESESDGLDEGAEANPEVLVESLSEEIDEGDDDE